MKFNLKPPSLRNASLVMLNTAGIVKQVLRMGITRSLLHRH